MFKILKKILNRSGNATIVTYYNVSVKPKNTANTFSQLINAFVNSTFDESMPIFLTESSPIDNANETKSIPLPFAHSNVAPTNNISSLWELFVSHVDSIHYLLLSNSLRVARETFKSNAPVQLVFLSKFSFDIFINHRQLFLTSDNHSIIKHFNRNA